MSSNAARKTSLNDCASELDVAGFPTVELNDKNATGSSCEVMTLRVQTSDGTALLWIGESGAWSPARNSANPNISDADADAIEAVINGAGSRIAGKADRGRRTSRR